MNSPNMIKATYVMDFRTEAYINCYPNSAFENLLGVCLWIWEPHFQLSYVKLSV